MKKQIWEITESDLKNHPVWVFPMTEDEDSDEATVQPASESEASDPNTQVIVASEFTDNNGNSYSGYIYWVKPELLEHLQPCMFNAGGAVTFWFGMSEPKANEMDGLHFPISVVSDAVFGLEKISIELEGFYYVNQAGKAELVRPTS